MTQDHTVEVRDTSDLRKYRTEIPNIIDEILINPYHFRVYCKLKRIAGQNGKCWSGNNELADLCGMGLTQYKKSKKFLSEPFEELGGRPLIVITNSKLSNGTNAHSVIEIVDIWEDNFTYMIEKYKNNKEIGGRSPHDLGSVTTRPTSVTTRPQKKEPNKKKPIKKEREGVNPSCPPPSISKKIERYQNVFCTDKEHEDLVEEYGNDLTQVFYTLLGDWKEITPKSKWKKGDYLSIKRWVVEKHRESVQKEKKGGVFQKAVTITEIRMRKQEVHDKRQNPDWKCVGYQVDGITNISTNEFLSFKSHDYEEVKRKWGL